MNIIDFSKVDIGDIILTTSVNKVPSGVIKKITNSDISHASIAVDSFSVIDSTSIGVMARNTKRLFFEDNLPIWILKPKDPLNDYDKFLLTRYLREVVGVPYSKKQAVNVITKLPINATEEMFCSRLCALAYEQIDRDIVENIAFCSPQELKDSPFFKILDGREYVSDEFVERVQSKRDMTEEMILSLMYILREARILDGSILGLNGVIKFLLNNPSYDEKVLRIFKDSKYFDLVDEERHENNFEFNFNQFVNSFDADIQGMVSEAWKIVNVDNSRHRLNLTSSKKHFKDTQLKTFRELTKLYSKCVKYGDQRRKVAIKVLLTFDLDNYKIQFRHHDI